MKAVTLFILAVLSALPVLLPAQMRTSELPRIVKEFVVFADDLPTTYTTTGVMTNYTVTGDEENGDPIPFDPISGGDARTLYIGFDEADADGAHPTIRVKGRNQFGGLSELLLTFYGDSFYICKAPFVNESLTMEWVDTTGLEAGDELNISPWGVGLLGDPQRPQDVLMAAVNGVAQDVAAVWAAQYVTDFSVWNPPAGTDLDDGDTVTWLIRSSSARRPQPYFQERKVIPSPTPTPSPTPSPTATPAPTATPEPTATPAPSPTPE